MMLNFCAPDVGFKATWIHWEHFFMPFHSLTSNSGKAWEENQARVKLYSLGKAQCFGETHHYLQGRRGCQAVNEQSSAFCLLLLVSCWLILLSWGWRRYVPPKYCAFYRLYSITTQNIILFKINLWEQLISKSSVTLYHHNIIIFNTVFFYAEASVNYHWFWPVRFKECYH
jgi:hypothetical protein